MHCEFKKTFLEKLFKIHPFQFEYELACNEVLGWKKRSTTVEGFTKEVNTFCDPSPVSVLHTIVQDKYRSLPCSIM